MPTDCFTVELGIQQRDKYSSLDPGTVTAPFLRRDNSHTWDFTPLASTWLALYLTLLKWTTGVRYVDVSSHTPRLLTFTLPHHKSYQLLRLNQIPIIYTLVSKYFNLTLQEHVQKMVTSTLWSLVLTVHHLHKLLMFYHLNFIIA